MVRDFPVSVLPDGGTYARTWLDEPVPAREPRLAATVMLVRDGADGVEVFMMRRAVTMAFAPQMMVFPGGSVDPADHDPLLPMSGSTPSGWAAANGIDESVATGVLAASVREVYEECGVLLAATRSAGPGGGTADRDPIADPGALRADLAAGTVAVGDVLRAGGREVRADDFVVRAHWVTPVFERRRFDTWVLAARMPAGQQVWDVSGEADRSGWTTARDVLALRAAGAAGMLPPTQVCLEELAESASVDDFLVPRPPRPRVEPVLVRRDDGELVLRAALGEGER